MRPREAPAADDVYDDEGADGGGGDNHQHHDNLIFDSGHRIRAGQNLSGHHTGKRDEANGHEGVDGWNHTGFHHVAQNDGRGLLIGGAQAQGELDLVSLFAEVGEESFQGDCDGVHGIADNHSAQGNEVLRGVPGFDLDDYGGDQDGHCGVTGDHGNERG